MQRIGQTSGVEATVTEDDLFEIADPVLRGLGSSPEVGEEFRSPELDVLHYFRRRVRLHPVPVLGRASSVVAVVRQPGDVHLEGAGYGPLLKRLAMAINGRFPPWSSGLTVGLSALVLTTEPIGPEDDAGLLRALESARLGRVVPLGLFRLDLDREALAFALRRTPDDLFPEPEALADALAERFRRFVQNLEM
ncbi:MAG TPA: hypothetical protein VG406_26665 [Isosphaeraceae bacterium]|nr:hypothetical protein [Isosphaeraceae bacterium]